MASHIQANSMTIIPPHQVLSREDAHLEDDMQESWTLKKFAKEVEKGTVQLGEKRQTVRKLASENTRILRQKVSKNLRAGFSPILRQRPNKCTCSYIFARKRIRERN